MDTAQQKKYNVLLIGDTCIDVYQYGIVDRISPEAPVPIIKITHQEEKPGMASNVKCNLEAFGLNVYAVTGEPSTKTRMIDSRSRQHVLRIDNDVISAPFSPSIEFLRTIVQGEYDVIVISDYNKGFITYQFVEELALISPAMVFIDSKKTDLARFNRCIIKVNEHEYHNRTSTPDNLIVTRGNLGAEYIQNKLGLEQRFVGKRVEVVDVCGAGDTFLAALVAQFLNTGSIEEGIIYANRAAAIAVQHSGVYTLTQEDIESIKRV